jgi:3-isopropylmalate/(R)-2-methylmalate dehydratase large subunit
MGKTVVQKILSRAAGRDLKIGETVWVEPDLMVMHDRNAARYLRVVNRIGAKVRNPEKLAISYDHKVPCGDAAGVVDDLYLKAEMVKHGITKVYLPGDHGISHQVVVDKGLAQPGSLVLASDTHTNTIGGIGALAIPISSGMPTMLVLGKHWLLVPETIQIRFEGHLAPGVMGRDVGLAIIDMVGRRADYKVLEFTGPGAATLDIDQRLTICNMSIEVGAKAAIFDAPYEGAVPAQYAAIAKDGYVNSDPDAEFIQQITVNLCELQPLIAGPPRPEVALPLSTFEGKPVTQVYIGSCAGGRIEDIRAAARVLKGRHIAEGIRCFIVPSSTDIYKAALRECLIETVMNAGAVVLTPSCGPCFGYQAPLGDGDVCISTATRNEPGRMGSASAEIYLANAATCAASAITGKITDARKLMAQ